MAKETVELASAPFNENCAAVGTANYTTIAFRECKAYLKQLQRHYQKVHGKELPESCRLKVKSNLHDFGNYYEVAVTFDTESEVAVEAAFWLENNQPEFWDDIAKEELKDLPSDNGWTL